MRAGFYSSLGTFWGVAVWGVGVSAGGGRSARVGPVATPSAAGLGVSVGERAVGTLPRLEVRLRKVHLVRPDLIPYPIAFEVVC
jgi:hypothetical protein